MIDKHLKIRSDEKLTQSIGSKHTESQVSIKIETFGRNSNFYKAQSEK